MRKRKFLHLFTLPPPFYDAPLYKDVNVYLRRIEEDFGVRINKYTYLKWAFGNDVFVVNDAIVFRFPRAEQTKEHFKYEIGFLNFLRDRVKINIPNYSYISRKGDVAGYDIISGKVLTASTFRVLNKENKQRVVDQLIEFINVFHKINLKEFAKYKPAKREDFISIEERIENELKSKLFPKLSEKEVEIINKFYREAKVILQNVPSSCPIHGDLYAYNVIWDKDKQELGVIDFSDYQVGDPARDFEVFYDYGREYAEMAYEKYKGSKDKEFLQRAQIYYKAHGIYTLLSSLLGAHISFKYAYSHFFKKKFS